MRDQERTCFKCGSLAGSSHVNEASCTEWLKRQVQESYRMYLGWKKRLEAAEKAWADERAKEAADDAG